MSIKNITMSKDSDRIAELERRVAALERCVEQGKAVYEVSSVGKLRRLMNP